MYMLNINVVYMLFVIIILLRGTQHYEMNTKFSKLNVDNKDMLFVIIHTFHFNSNLL